MASCTDGKMFQSVISAPTGYGFSAIAGEGGDFLRGKNIGFVFYAHGEEVTHRFGKGGGEFSIIRIVSPPTFRGRIEFREHSAFCQKFLNIGFAYFIAACLFAVVFARHFAGAEKIRCCALADMADLIELFLGNHIGNGLPIDGMYHGLHLVFIRIAGNPRPKRCFLCCLKVARDIGKLPENCPNAHFWRDSNFSPKRGLFCLSAR